MKEEIESIVREVLLQYPIKRAAFFGSFARGDTTESSDVDIIVEFLPGTPGLEFFGLLVDLKEALEPSERSVDLITWRGLYQSSTSVDFRQAVEAEARMIYEL